MSRIKRVRNAMARWRHIAADVVARSALDVSRKKTSAHLRAVMLAVAGQLAIPCPLRARKSGATQAHPRSTLARTHLAVARYQGRRVTTVAKALRCQEELAVLA
jgi:hypothetical protein